MSRRYKWTCLLWLVVAMAWGALLRWYGVSPVEGLNYRYALHTHSHIALLGWVVMGFFVLLAERFLEERRSRAFKCLFWFQQFALFGMLVSFPVQGYAAFSIAFSTLFVFGTYLFSWWLYRDCGDEVWPVRQLLRSAAVFLLVSSIGPYVVGFLKAKGLEASPNYANALYFYLHFLYNGFFVSGLLALVFSELDTAFFGRLPLWEVQAFLLGVGLSYFLSVLWVEPPPIVYSLGAAGGALQLMIGTRWFWAMERFSKDRVSALVRIALWLLLAKFAMQLVSALPEVAAWLFVRQHYTIIGYIHFVMLGVMTPFVFAKLFPAAFLNWTGKVGACLYGTGFLVTEALLFGAGLWSGLVTAIPFVESLFAGYAVLVIGALAAVSGARGKEETTAVCSA